MEVVLLYQSPLGMFPCAEWNFEYCIANHIEGCCNRRVPRLLFTRSHKYRSQRFIQKREIEAIRHSRYPLHPWLRHLSAACSPVGRLAIQMGLVESYHSVGLF